jgi:hypothetical protein
MPNALAGFPCAHFSAEDSKRVFVRVNAPLFVLDDGRTLHGPIIALARRYDAQPINRGPRDKPSPIGIVGAQNQRRDLAPERIKATLGSDRYEFVKLRARARASDCSLDQLQLRRAELAPGN